MLVFGFVFSGAGIGLALTGVADEDQSAAAAQYDGAPGPQAPPEQPGGEVPEPGQPGQPGPPTLEPEAQPEGQPEAPDEVTRQWGAAPGGEELPFTGFAAIPLLLLGFALLTTGFVLRR